MCKSVLNMANQRPSFIEERRSKLTCQLKNAVLIHLVNLKAAKSKLTFKEVIAQVVQRKKDDMKKERKKKMMLLRGEVEAIKDEMTFEGLDKNQTEYIMSKLSDMKNKYQKNNQMMEEIERISTEIVH